MIWVLTLALVHLVSGHEGDQFSLTNWTAEEQWPAGELNCAHGLREFNPLTQKRVYHIGVHAPAGIDTAWREFNLTFEAYLNAAVGERWNPPIEFKMKATESPLVDWIDNKEDVDFMYSDTGIYSCFGTEVGGQPLGTTISQLQARGRTHELDVFAGKPSLLSQTVSVSSITQTISYSSRLKIRHNVGVSRQ
jgi:hypothetical protein